MRIRTSDDSIINKKINSFKAPVLDNSDSLYCSLDDIKNWKNIRYGIPKPETDRMSKIWHLKICKNLYRTLLQKDFILCETSQVLRLEIKL